MSDAKITAFVLLVGVATLFYAWACILILVMP
jgi:hypothetical protein